MRASDFRGGISLDPAKVPLRDRAAELPLQARYQLPLSDRLGRVAPQRVTAGSAVRHGQLIAGDDDSVAVHAPTSGALHWIDTPAGPAAQIDADGAHTAIESQEPVPATRESLARVWEAGLVGMGGAGFPSADKLAAAGQPRTLIVNAVECEPVVNCDSQLLLDEAPTAVRGVRWLCEAMGMDRAVFAFEPHATQARSALMAELAGTDDPRLSIGLVPARYPAGSERQLVQALTGQALPPGVRPAAQGIVVHNISTMHALGRWVVGGLPLTRRLITVAGDHIAEPQAIWAPIGTPLRALLNATGWRGGDSALRLGGPMMGRLLADPDATTLAKHHYCLLAETARAPRPERACIHCGECAAVCPENLQPQQLHTALRDGPERAVLEGLDRCILCGCCDPVCPSDIRLSEAFGDGRKARAALLRQREMAERSRARSQARDERLARVKAERAQRRAGASGQNDRKRAISEALARGRRKAKSPSRSDEG